MAKLTLLMAAFVATVTCLAALASPAAAVTVSPTPGQPQVIAIPMTMVPHGNTPGSAAPNVVITGDCGTAFLYPSNGHDHVHFDFGFKHLNIAHYAVSGSIHGLSVDYGDYDSHSYSGPSFSSTWEKQGNLYVDGEVLVSATIHAYGYFHDCVSSPGLHQYIYVY